ncbi:hypothetical protein Tco_0609357 [Tanacetum coccineum]
MSTELWHVRCGYELSFFCDNPYVGQASVSAYFRERSANPRAVVDDDLGESWVVQQINLDIREKLDGSRISKFSHERKNVFFKWSINKMLSKTLWTYLKHVPESVQIKRVALFVHLKSDGVLVVRSSILEFLHVDSRDTCSDQKGLMKGSVRENIQCNLKCRLFRFECGVQFVIAASNLETLFPWNKNIIKCLLLFICDTHDSAKKETTQFIYKQVYIDTISKDSELALNACNTFLKDNH